MRSRKAATVAASLPLFERATRSSIVMLVVRRLEEDGRWMRAPTTFSSDELADRETVRARFGGGKYEVIGRDAQRIVARTTFLLDGPRLPLAPASPVATPVVRERGERAFGSDEGERQALTYRLFGEGLTCIAVTQRTGIDDDTVRDIYLRWLTPDGAPRPTTPAEIAQYKAQRAAELRAELRSEWDPA